MADEQPNTLSTDVQTPDAPSAAPSSDESPSESSKSPSWWQRITRSPSFRGREAQPEDGEAAQADGTSEPLKLSQEELDRRIQAETDRREAKRAAEARAKQRKELRDTDPWAYAEELRKEEELESGNQNLTKFFNDIGAHHDRAVLDPLFLTLPKAEQERITKLEGAGVGLKGRELVVKESLKALEKHWKAEGAREAENKLRRNPAFRKQVLSEVRTSFADEPDLLPAASSSVSDRTVSALLRKHYDMG